MQVVAPHVRDLVLVGGGHSNIQVLKYFGMRFHPGIRLTLISSFMNLPYSGMISGLVAGQYQSDNTHINLERLCQFAGARFIRGEVAGLELEQQRILLLDRPSIRYDLLSLNVGSTSPSTFKSAFSIKPIAEFEKNLELLDQTVRENQTLSIVGSGAAGLEMSFALKARYQEKLRINLVGQELLSGLSPRATQRILNKMKFKGISFIEGYATQFKDQTLSFRNRPSIETDYVVEATGAASYAWIKDSGLSVDNTGFVKVDRYLKSVSHSTVFAVGDVACLEGQERPKSGVFAVREGKKLVHNLVAALYKKQLKPYRAQKKHLSLINCCDGTAIAVRGGFVSLGKIWWRYKNIIDKKFVSRFNDLEFMPGSEQSLPDEFSHEVSPETMRCNGCGAKLAADPLRRVLERLDIYKSDVIELGVGDDAARIVTANGKMLLTIDGFRALVSDPYLFGRITAHHSLNDIFAMGATPKIALCLATVPYMAERLMEEDLYQLLSGINDVLSEHGVSLVGGHTAEGMETSLGLMVTGTETGPSKEKGHARVGDSLILTKPIGTGVVLAAASVGGASAESMSFCLDQMDKSNFDAMQIFMDENVSALTDVTGYGLAGHLAEILRASGCGVSLELNSIPFLLGSPSLVKSGYTSSLQNSNEQVLMDFELKKGLSMSVPELKLLADPQTAGGLLAAIPAENVSRCLDNLNAVGYTCACVGSIEEENWLIR